MAGARYSVFLNRPMKRRWGEINLSVNRQNDGKSKRPYLVSPTKSWEPFFLLSLHTLWVGVWLGKRLNCALDPEPSLSRSSAAVSSGNAPSSGALRRIRTPGRSFSPYNGLARGIVSGPVVWIQ